MSSPAFQKALAATGYVTPAGKAAPGLTAADDPASGKLRAVFSDDKVGLKADAVFFAQNTPTSSRTPVRILRAMPKSNAGTKLPGTSVSRRFCGSSRLRKFASTTVTPRRRYLPSSKVRRRRWDASLWNRTTGCESSTPCVDVWRPKPAHSGQARSAPRSIAVTASTASFWQRSARSKTF